MEEPCWTMCLKLSRRIPWRPSDAGHIDAPWLAEVILDIIDRQSTERQDNRNLGMPFLPLSSFLR